MSLIIGQCLAGAHPKVILFTRTGDRDRADASVGVSSAASADRRLGRLDLRELPFPLLSDPSQGLRVAGVDALATHVAAGPVDPLRPGEDRAFRASLFAIAAADASLCPSPSNTSVMVP